MVHELFYTSAERGLELGTTGFCTVARTRGLPKRLERLLHSLSVYKWDLRTGHNPVVYMHTRANLDGQSLFILSRVAPAPVDYSGRSNYFAHHVVLTQSELPQAGPVWLMRQPGFLEQQWDGQVKELPTGRAVSQGNAQPRRCTTWERVTGDAGWAGLLLKYLLDGSTAPVYLIADDSLPVLGLLDEVIALLPVEKRWQVTFTTRYIQLPSEVSCSVRVVSPNSEKIAEAKASPRKVDLAALRGQKAPDDPYTKAARSGQTVSMAESQYLIAQDEPFLPPGSAAFAQLSGGVPPPRATAVSANPSSAVAPMQPPVPPLISPRSHTPFWLVLLVLLNLVLVAALGTLFAIQQENYRRELAELEQKLAHQLEEQSNKNVVKVLKALQEDLKLEAQRDARSQHGADQQIRDRLNKLEQDVRELKNTNVDKNSQRTGSDEEFVKKLLSQAMESFSQRLLQQLVKEMEKMGLTEKALEGVKQSARAVAENERKKVIEGIGLDRLEPGRVRQLVMKKELDLYGSKERKGTIEKVVVHAPNAKVDQKTHVLEPGKPSYRLNTDPDVALRLEKDSSVLKLTLNMRDKPATDEEIENQVKPILAGMTVVVFAKNEFKVIVVSQTGGEQ